MISKAFAAVAAGAVTVAASASIGVVPMPNKVVEKEGVFKCEGDWVAKIEYASDAAIPPEGYRLDVTPERISVWSSDDAGRFYAVQTLRQLGNPIQCVEIEDAPRFKWRGLLFDDGRHFFGKETLMKTLDAMAVH